MASTLADVAKKAGVSTATVSRVLNNKMVMPIPQSTIGRIQDAARELEYRPNALARALVTRKTNTVGLFTSEMTDPQFSQMLEGVEAKARANGYRVVVCGELEGLLTDGRVDGALLLAPPETLAAVRAPIPGITVWNAQTPIRNCISWSDFEGAYKSGRYLLELGHRNIVALLGYGDSPYIIPDKMFGFRKAMQGGSSNYLEMQEVLSEDGFENGYLLTRRLLVERPNTTAIFARNDFLAVGALKALREAGISVPKRMSVVGYNDTMLARCAEPALTSVRTPIGEAGARAVESLVEAIECGGKAFPGVALPTTLTLRDSCGPPPEL